MSLVRRDLGERLRAEIHTFDHKVTNVRVGYGDFSSGDHGNVFSVSFWIGGGRVVGLTSCTVDIRFISDKDLIPSGFSVHNNLARASFGPEDPTNTPAGDFCFQLWRGVVSKFTIPA